MIENYLPISKVRWNFLMNVCTEDKSVVKIPSDPKDIPKKIPYLLIGGGTASFSAFRAIKAADPTAKVIELYFEKNNNNNWWSSYRFIELKCCQKPIMI